MNQRTAPLRCCARCMWIFTWEPGTPCPECPQCAFGHYGARHVFGDKAYRYAKTQQPWYDRQMEKHSEKLRAVITSSTRP